MRLAERVRRLNQPGLRIAIYLALGALALALIRPHGARFRPLDRMPSASGAGRVVCEREQMVLHLSGAPEELGRQHGTLLGKSIRRLLDGYVHELVSYGDPVRLKGYLARVREMKPSLPDWYLDELRACAQAVEVDEDELLLAQSEGDIVSIGPNPQPPRAACSAYVVFGDPSIAGGEMRAGRNFDYIGGDLVGNCALVTYVEPEPGGGYPFVAVGWSGILGGGTLVNSERLVIANHLGGGPAKDPSGIPTLIMTRILAQKCGTIDEALDMLRELPRMRGQIIWMAQPADPASGREARAVAAEFDADDVYIREADAGVLTVGNSNLVFGGRKREDRGSVHADLSAAVRAGGDGPERIITATGRPNTLHSVEVDFEQGRLYVAHGRLPAQDGPFVDYELPR